VEAAVRASRQPHEDPGEDFNEADFASTSRRTGKVPFFVILLPTGRSPETAVPADVRAIVAPAMNALEAESNPEVVALRNAGHWIAETIGPGDRSRVRERIHQRTDAAAAAAEKDALGFRDANSSRWGLP
jgi:hypothetical protein